MELEEEFKTKPVGIFILLQKLLVLNGCIPYTPKRRYVNICYQMYRVFWFILITMFLIQDIISINMLKHDLRTCLDSIIILIPNFSFWIKFIVLSVGQQRHDNVIELLNDPIFAAHNEKHEEIITKNNKMLHVIVKRLYICVFVCVVFWIITQMLQKLQDDDFILPFFMPFETKSWSRFIIVVIIHKILILLGSCGQMSMDVLMAAHYAQVRVQLKIIKSNLENLCDNDQKVRSARNGQNSLQYADNMDIKQRFVKYVKRYEKVMWYIEEIKLLFDFAISFQLMSTSTSICMVTFLMSLATPGSIDFYYLLCIFLIAQGQVIIFCYYGEMVQDESAFVTTSIYLSDWVSLSPQFRRMVVIAMERWNRPVQLYLIGIIPMTLNTFITILKSTYTLYTILKSTGE